MNRLNSIGKALIAGLVLLLTMPQIAHARARIPVGTRDVIDSNGQHHYRRQTGELGTYAQGVQHCLHPAPMGD